MGNNILKLDSNAGFHSSIFNVKLLFLSAETEIASSIHGHPINRQWEVIALMDRISINLEIMALAAAWATTA